MLDILACPIDKYFPLELITINTNPKIRNNDLEFDSDIIIMDGLLFCSHCSRYYPIIDAIPVMLPDELRDKKNDIDFLERWKNNIPEKILYHGNPWHL